MASWDVEGVATLLARRNEFLRAVRDGTKPKRTLVEEHDVSRSTVNRAVRELESKGLLDRENGAVSLTLTGRLALDAYVEFADALAGLDEAATILEPLPADTSFCLDLLRGATVTETEPHTPHRPISALEDLLTEASTVLTYSTVVIPELVSRYRDMAVEGDCTLEVVANRPVIDTLVSEHAELLDESLRAGTLELYETRQTGPSYSFIVVDRGGGDWVVATLHGEHGITGVLENEREAAVEWLRERYEVLRSDAERLA